MRRLKILALILALCSGPALAQVSGDGTPPGELQNSRPALFSNLTQGFAASIRTWDLALVGLLSLDRTMSESSQPIAFGPFGFDRRITTSVGRTTDGETFGSRVSPATIQTAIFCTQLGVTAILDITGAAEVTPRDYERAFVFGKTMLYTLGVTQLAKNLTLRERPDGSNTRSFFSGHTSASFAASTFLYRQVGDWMDDVSGNQTATEKALTRGALFAGCYGWAAYVGYSRIYDRKHYLTDVLVGAAAGTVLAWWIYDQHFGEPTGALPPAFQLSIFTIPQPSLGVRYAF